MKQIALGMIISAILLGCSGKDGAPGPAGKDGGYLTGSLSGSVNLYDEFGNTIAGVNGTSIEIEGSSPLINYTPTEQNFTISGVKTGTYRLKFTNQGYGTSYSNVFQFIGGNFIYTDISFRQEIAQIPSAKISDFSLAAIDSTSSTSFYLLTISGKVDQAITTLTPRILVIYSNNSPEVSSTNYEDRTSQSLNVGDGTFQIHFSLSKSNFSTNIYILGQLKAINSSYYADLNTNLLVPSSLGSTSQVIKVK